MGLGYGIILKMVTVIMPEKGRPSLGKGLRGSGVFLTFPQSKVGSVGELWGALRGVLEGASGLHPLKHAVAKEHHKDGNVHYHCVIKFSARVRFSPTQFDVLGEHPNVQTLKNENASLVYIGKECKYEDMDTDYDPSAFLPLKRRRLKQENAEMLEEHKKHGLKGLVDEGFIPLLKIKDAREAISIYSSLGGVDARGSLPEVIPNTFGILMNATGKKRHYWIWGGSNTGKTTFGKTLVEKYRGCFLNLKSKWQATVQFSDEFYILDEFNRHWSAQDLNSLCDGNYLFDVKYSNPVVTNPRARVFVLSNYALTDQFPGAVDQSTLTNRFNIITLGYVWFPPIGG